MSNLLHVYFENKYHMVNINEINKDIAQESYGKHWLYEIRKTRTIYDKIQKMTFVSPKLSELWQFLSVKDEQNLAIFKFLNLNISGNF